MGLSREECRSWTPSSEQSRRLKRGEYLFRAGEPFKVGFAVRTGFFQTCVGSHDGREQVTGFHMSGELLGLDGISANAHGCDSIALEDSEVCELPFARMESLAATSPVCNTIFPFDEPRNRARPIGDAAAGQYEAEERLAAFLLNRRCVFPPVALPPMTLSCA